MGVFGYYIIPKWLIEVPGHFGILFRWFRELRKFSQNLDPETSGLSPKCFKKYKKNYGIILEKYYFVHTDLNKIDFFRNLYVLGTRFVRCVFRLFFRLFFISCFLCFFLVAFLNIYFENNFTKRRNENYTFSITKQHPNLDLNFISIKNMNRNLP